MIFFFLKETKNNILKDLFLSICTIFIFTVVLFNLGLYILAHTQITYILEDMTRDTLIRVFFHPDINDNELLNKKIDMIRQTGYFSKIELIHKNDALDEFYRLNPHLRMSVDELRTNPLPHSINLEISSIISDFLLVDAFLNGLESMGSIDEVVYSREWISKFSRLMVSTRYITLFIGITLLFFSVIIIFIITNLNIYYRKDIIEIMKLIGSPYRNIKVPVIIEGVLNGLLSGLIASGAIYLLFNNIYARLIELKGIFDSIMVRVDMSFYIMMIVFGVLAGSAGSYTAIEYYLCKDRKA